MLIIDNNGFQSLFHAPTQTARSPTCEPENPTKKSACEVLLGKTGRDRKSNMKTEDIKSKLIIKQEF